MNGARAVSELKAFSVYDYPDGWSELIFAQNATKAKAHFYAVWGDEMDQEFIECVNGLRVRRLPKADKYVEPNIESPYILDWGFNKGEVHRENGFDVDGEFI